ncbi:hypothetical protein D4S03_09385 [bacterium]|nr:MAG: hypothetical protein D4S03_09385 [bacterium]
MQSKFHHASIIIDDPLLRENYGFLNYRKLLNLMDKHNFFTTIAFIPFNFNRTDKRIAALFRERPDRFSLCVHGCDHTKGEFGKTDFNHLDDKVKLATARMIEHERRTGIPFDRIMVFPQGIFSNAALGALKKNNYLAAVNTEAMPVDGHISSNFPFFLRYNPEDVINCGSDPTFITLHHDYFKNGYERLTDFVDELNTRSKNVKWDSLGNIVRSFVSTNEVDYNPADVDLSGLKFHGYNENVKILLRRHASEFRDNYLCKNDFLLNCAKQVKNLISK